MFVINCQASILEDILLSIWQEFLQIMITKNQTEKKKKQGSNSRKK